MKADIQKRLAEVEAKRYKPERLDIFIVPPRDNPAIRTGTVQSAHRRSKPHTPQP